MDDRITEIREAVALVEEGAKLHPGGFLGTVCAAARAYVDLLESDALIIRRDENGEWPEDAIKTAKLAAMAEAETIDYQGERVGLTERNDRMMRASLDALASSQGVEPQLEEQQ